MVDDEDVMLLLLAASMVMMIAVVEFDDVILTEPLFRSLRDEEVLFVLVQNFIFLYVFLAPPPLPEVFIGLV